MEHVPLFADAEEDAEISPYFARYQAPREMSYEVPYNPRPSIAHLLLLTAATSLYLGSFRWIEQSRSGARPDLPSWWQVVYLLGAIVHGPAIAALLIAARRRWRGIAFPRQPGEWWLCLMGVQVAGWMMTYGVFVLVAGARNMTFAFYAALMASNSAIMAILCFYAGYRVRTQGKWPRLFKLCGALFACHFVALMLSAAFTGRFSFLLFSSNGLVHLFTAALTIAFAIAARRADRRRAIERGWLHGLGVATLFASLALRSLTDLLNLVAAG